jgi:hypothetical protein
MFIKMPVFLNIIGKNFLRELSSIIGKNIYLAHFSSSLFLLGRLLALPAIEQGVLDTNSEKQLS